MPGQGVQVAGALCVILGVAIVVGGMADSAGFGPFFLVLFMPVWLGLLVAGALLLRHGVRMARQAKETDPWAYDQELDGPDADDL